VTPMAAGASSSSAGSSCCLGATVRA
jgi:hypothetical protein